MQVAVKEMSLSYEEFTVMDAEMTFMSTFRHPKLVGHYYNNKNAVIIYDIY